MRSVEQTVRLDAATTYVNVVRDLATVRSSENNVKVRAAHDLDVLNAQLDLVTSQISFVQALRDRIVAEYSLYAAVALMDTQTLGLSVPHYDPIEHCERQKPHDSALWVVL